LRLSLGHPGQCIFGHRGFGFRLVRRSMEESPWSLDTARREQ